MNRFTKRKMEVKERDKFTCQYCFNVFPPEKLTIDHVRPVSKGGSNDITNLVAACRGCNMQKGSKYKAVDTLIACRCTLCNLNFKSPLSRFVKRCPGCDTDLWVVEYAGYAGKKTKKKSVPDAAKKPPIDHVIGYEDPNFIRI